jgi:hypothetical protein
LLEGNNFTPVIRRPLADHEDVSGYPYMQLGADQNQAQHGTANDISYDFNHYESVYPSFIGNNRITNDNRYSNHM